MNEYRNTETGSILEGPRFEVPTISEGEMKLELAIEGVLRSGLYLHQYSQEQIDQVANMLTNEQATERNSSEGFDVLQLSKVDQESLQSMWGVLAPNIKSKRVVHPLINQYEPYSLIPKHVDLTDRPTVVGADEPIESMLTFLYVVEGSKSINFYAEQYDHNPIKMQQYPGMLFVFAMGDMINEEGELIARAPYHEVPRQNARAKTISWELGNF